MAAVTCLHTRDEGGPIMLLQSLWYPATNIHTLETESYEVMSEGYNLKREDMAWLKSQYLASPALADQSSVSHLLGGNLSDLPPMYIMTAHFDILRYEPNECSANIQLETPIYSFIRQAVQYG